MSGCEALTVKQKSSVWCKAAWDKDWWACDM